MESTSQATRYEVQDPRLIQLYSAATPNGLKVASALEELVDLRRLCGEDFSYEPHTVNIRTGECRQPGFTVSVNPNGKIPAIIDPAGNPNDPCCVWESGSILLYLAEKYNELIPPENDTKNRVQCINWLLWASSGLSVQCKLFGFYYKYCPHRLPYCITRYENEVRRLLGVLETQLAKHQKHWVLGDQFSIADLAIWPWIYALHENYDNCIQDVFGELKEFPLVKEYYTRCMSRPASRRALDVTRFID